jgi:hypothetical protein
MIFFIDSFVPYRTSCLQSHKKTKRHIPAKIYQQEATRAEIMSNGDFNKNTVYDGKWKYDNFIASRGFSDTIMTAR